MSIIEQKLYKSLYKKNLFEINPVIAVAVSGGPDSIALVFLLNKWIRKNKGKLIALIIDHQIRENSLKEASFVKKYLGNNNIQSLILKVPKKNVLKGKMTQARENRYLKIINYQLLYLQSLMRLNAIKNFVIKSLKTIMRFVVMD